MQSTLQWGWLEDDKEAPGDSPESGVGGAQEGLTVQATPHASLPEGPRGRESGKDCPRQKNSTGIKAQI